MAAAVVVRPSSQGRQAAIAALRPTSACRTLLPEASMASRLPKRPPMERRGQPGQPPARRPLPEASNRQFSRTAPSSGLRSASSSSSANAAAAPGITGTAASRRNNSSVGATLNGPGVPGSNAARVRTDSRLGCPSMGNRPRGVSTGSRQPERRRSTTTIRAGMMVASTSNLGNCSNASSSPRSSNPGGGSDVCQETGEDFTSRPPTDSSSYENDVRRAGLEEGTKEATRATGSTSGREPRRTASLPLLQVPAGVEEDFEPFTWLSDAGIAFASSCLASSGNSILTSKPRKFPKSVMFMDPAMAFWLTMQDDLRYLEEAKADMKLQDLDLILCPINDAHTACSADAGCHWSLLACWGNKRGNLSNFRYYDSLGGLFAEKGTAMAEELATRLGGQSVKVETGSCAQQTNFYDCGVYVLLFSEVIATAFLDAQRKGLNHSISPAAWEERLCALTPEEVDACRTHYHNLARDKALP